MTSSFPEFLVEYGKKDLFSDFCAEQDARNTIHLNVLKYSYMLCDALHQNFIDYNIKSHQRSMGVFGATPGYHQQKIDDLKNGICDYEFTIESGRKYHKIILNAAGQRSASCFIDKKTGEVYKPASYKAPAKGVRYNLLLIKDREWILENADWSGSWLYKH